jgi:hypothetical protein
LWLPSPLSILVKPISALLHCDVRQQLWTGIKVSWDDASSMSPGSPRDGCDTKQRGNDSDDEAGRDASEKLPPLRE